VVPLSDDVGMTVRSGFVDRQGPKSHRVGTMGHHRAMHQVIVPSGIAPPAAAYAHAVSTVSASKLLHTSGVVPIAFDGSTPVDLGEQAALVWANIRAIVEAAGFLMTDIVSITTYVVAGEPLGPVMAARDTALAGHLAASTLVTVPALAREEWRMEIAVVAAA
jgi:2-iminobutanoate/2-iminopropanoate deaminase